MSRCQLLRRIKMLLVNRSNIAAIFIRLNIVNGHGNDIVPVLWDDNCVTLLPHASSKVIFRTRGHAVQVRGVNIKPF